MASEEPRSRPATVESRLQDILLHLTRAQSVVVVAVAALRQQSVELDEDIAAVLQCNVADRLQDQIEKLETAVRELADLSQDP